jgi:uncharacterized protein (DUF1330 family)
MKIVNTVALSMIAGAVLGGTAIQNLQAQPKAPVYLITETDVTNHEEYGQAAAKAQATVKAAGGKFIIIGGAGGVGAKPVNVVYGTPPQRITVSVWESMDALKKWYDSAEYQGALKIGKQNATFRRFSVEGQ